ncbi:hypothetical protein EK21DRAFT_113786 [Setomelanomma holmii]|uniref:Uncharacterized protein n=1 Tax=Setomelanomma holmii TaxID=210430 RepID=A0A9P4H7P0_9PLEO|nr:hypothetical protein EK21DRAFT_113786 [Setomelanomma holmii]
MSTFTRFLELPTELRVIIYERISTFASEYTARATVTVRALDCGSMATFHSFSITSIQKKLPVALLATNSLVYSEARAIIKAKMRKFEPEMLEPIRLIIDYRGQVASKGLEPREAIEAVLAPRERLLQHTATLPRSCHQILIALPTGAPERVMSRFKYQLFNDLVDWTLATEASSKILGTGNTGVSGSTPRQYIDLMQRAMENRAEMRKRRRVGACEISGYVVDLENLVEKEWTAWLESWKDL